MSRPDVVGKEKNISRCKIHVCENLTFKRPPLGEPTVSFRNLKIRGSLCAPMLQFREANCGVIFAQLAINSVRTSYTISKKPEIQGPSALFCQMFGSAEDGASLSDAECFCCMQT